MSVLIYLIPIALFLGLLGLLAFIWSLKTGQYDDLDGDARRILFDDDENINNNDDVSENSSTTTSLDTDKKTDDKSSLK